MTKEDIKQFADTQPNVEEWVDFIERYVDEAIQIDRYGEVTEQYEKN